MKKPTNNMHPIQFPAQQMFIWAGDVDITEQMEARFMLVVNLIKQYEQFLEQEQKAKK